LPKDLKIIFVTDIHGSTRVFRKALNATKMFNIDYLVLGGDLVGKGVLPLYKQGDRYYDINGMPFEKSDIEQINKNGYYVYTLDSKKELENLTATDIDKIYAKFVEEQLTSWFELTRNKISSIPIVWNFGNDDPLFLEEIFKKHEVEVKDVFELDNSSSPLLIVNCSYTNETPYKSFRIVPDYLLFNKAEEKIKEALGYSNNLIFNFHAPPYNTKIDKALVNGKWEHVGSRAVRELIEKYQPLLGLHGHVHESSDKDKIGNTMVVNPGSLYQEEILRYSIIVIKREVKGIGVSYKVSSVNILRG